MFDFFALGRGGFGRSSGMGRIVYRITQPGYVAASRIYWWVRLVSLHNYNAVIDRAVGKYRKNLIIITYVAHQTLPPSQLSFLLPACIFPHPPRHPPSHSQPH